MGVWNEVLQLHPGEAVDAGDKQIVPLAQTVTLRWPGSNGGLIYNRPMAVLVQTAAGEEQRLPIHDQTRRLQLFMLIYAALSIMLMWLFASLQPGR